MNKCRETLFELALLTHPFLPTWCHTDYTLGVLWGIHFVYLCVYVSACRCICGGDHIQLFLIAR